MENANIGKRTKVNKFWGFVGLFAFNVFKRKKRNTTDFIQTVLHHIHLYFSQHLILSLIYRMYLLMPVESKNALMLYSYFLDNTKYRVTLANLFMQP